MAGTPDAITPSPPTPTSTATTTTATTSLSLVNGQYEVNNDTFETVLSDPTSTKSNDSNNNNSSSANDPSSTLALPTAEESAPAVKSTSTRYIEALVEFYLTYEFIIEVLVAIFVAWLYPPLGANYLQPNITSTWLAVAIIFLLSGLGLKFKEFVKAVGYVYFNAFVQIFNFGLVSLLSYALREALNYGGILSPALANGIVVNGCLPMTINTVIVFTKSAGGDEAAAIFNSTFANMVGVLLSPALILLYLGVSGNIDLGEVFFKLALTVVLPVVLGMALQQYSPFVAQFSQKHKKYFKYIQQYALVFIVYCTFCKTFQHNNNQSDSQKSTSKGDIFLMIAFMFVMLIALMVLAWYLLKWLFHDKPELRVMGLFGCTQKTAAVGVPLVSAIYGKDELLAYYLLPLLIWYPVQLLLGSMLVPKLALFMEREKARLLASTTTTTAADPNHDTIPPTDQPHDEHDEEAARR